MDKPFNIAHGLLHAKRRDSSEHEDRSIMQDIDVPDRPTEHSLFVPWSRLAPKIRSMEHRDLSTLTQGSGAFAVGTDVIGVRDSLRPSSLLMKFPITIISGLKGGAVLPRISTGVTAQAPISETFALTEADPTFGAAVGGPRRVAVWVKVSRQLIWQAENSQEFDAFLARELVRAINQQIDTLALTSPQGLLNLPAIAQAAAWVASAGWGQVMTVQTALENAFVDQTNMGWLLSTSAASNWRQIGKGSTTAFFILDQITNKVGGIYTYVTSLIGTSSFQTVLADWTNFVYGFWGNGIDIVYDPYTAASTGEVNLTATIYHQSWVTRPTTFQVAGSASVAFTS